ncbi:MAG TPA: FxSxx-COOH system tetratricopeptide repeat protein [Ktedonobacteraceae bacterium]|nr:FxSxx-COOH system tetratricopeptide repeat protein [Ktedonobacteraceae bacterium]
MLRGWTQGDVGGQVGTDGYTVNRWERGRAFPSPYFRRKLCELFGKNAEELGLLRERESNQVPRFLSPIWNVPFRRNVFFTGRESSLSYLHHRFHRDSMGIPAQIQAISGLGGIGKTQVAIEYAYRYAMDYKAVLWIGSDSPATFLISLENVARVLDLPDQYSNDSAYIARMVKQWLKEHADWLLVVDNIEELELITDIIPALHTGHILLTTRVQATGNIAHRIDINTMNLEEGSLLLLRRAKAIPADACLENASAEELAATRELVRAMDGLPLAIDQAASYIEEMGCSITEYLSRYQHEHVKMLSLRDTSLDHPASVNTTWSLSFEKIRYSDHRASELLQLCAFLQADNIPEELLREAVTELNPSSSPLMTDPLIFDTLTSELRKFSLIRRHPDTSTISIHRLIQVILRANMEEASKPRFIECLVRTLNRLFPVPDSEYSTWSLSQRYLSHILECIPYIRQFHIYLAEAGHLLQRAGEYLQERALDSQAQIIYQLAMDIREHLLGRDHPLVAESLDALASAYETLGKDAEPLYSRALEIRTAALGPGHPEVAASLNNLALFFYRKGRYSLPEPLYLRAAQIFEQTSGADHTSFAAVISNLGALYDEQGRYAEAEALQQRALAIRRRVLGPEHTLVAINLRILGMIYQKQGKYIQAETFLQQALSIREQSLGPEHPYVGTSLGELAALYRDQEKYTRAEELFQRALSIREKASGPNSVYVAYILNALAELHRKQKRYQLAEASYRRALMILEQACGPDHLEVAESLQGLGTLAGIQGDFVQAEQHCIRALDIREKVFGEKHLNVARSLNVLGKLYQISARSEQAWSFYLRALKILEKTVGLEHPQASVSLTGLADLLSGQERHDEAASLYQQALAIREQTLSAGPPDR